MKWRCRQRVCHTKGAADLRNTTGKRLAAHPSSRRTLLHNLTIRGGYASIKDQRVATQSLVNSQFYHPDSAIFYTDAPMNTIKREAYLFVFRTCGGHWVNGETCCAGSLGDVVGLKLKWFCVESDASKIVYVQGVLWCARNMRGIAARLSCNAANS